VWPDELPSFKELAEARRQLNEAVVAHRPSVNFFASTEGFRRKAPDLAGGAPLVPPEVALLGDAESIRGVTTAYTCFESLDDAFLDPTDPDPERFSGLTEKDRNSLVNFTNNALPRTDKWKSEGSARRYCIVRAIPPLVKLLPEHADSPALKALVNEVWSHVNIEPEHRAIYEVAAPFNNPDADGNQPGEAHEDEGETYPPNAFLTYWGIRSLQALPEVLEATSLQLGIAEMWLQGAIGREIGLQYAEVEDRDPQQLAWAISGMLVARPKSIAERSEDTKALIEAGLKCFFEQQLPNGGWPTGRPIFHYADAGNAYCYIYETLAELVSLSLDTTQPFSEELRKLLVPHLGRLIHAAGNLFATQRTLAGVTGAEVGWSSGHHPHRTTPESWATATAFRFLQALRRLVGWQVRQMSARELRSTRPGTSVSELPKRGSTWDAGYGSAGDLLAALFVNPRKAYPIQTVEIDPDRPVLKDDWARSAMLFGPPGTGKTSLARSVAGELGWGFVEITSADFLNRGTDFVSARADEIFTHLQELDEVVVLFDEIDELIRLRNGKTDMLGRLFTTTMLPRLARLWDARKLIFFVNTNSISDVDPAIRRSQRFDAAVFVLPPSFPRKLEFVPTEKQNGLTYDGITNILKTFGTTEAHDISPDSARAAWMAFLRFDQLGRMRSRLEETDETLLPLLVELGEETVSDWALVARDDHPIPDSPSPEAHLEWILEAYRSEAGYQRIDSGRTRLISHEAAIELPVGLKPSGVEGFAIWGDGIPAAIVGLDGAGKYSPA
jgi:hypothetical protein